MIFRFTLTEKVADDNDSIFLRMPFCNDVQADMARTRTINI